MLPADALVCPNCNGFVHRDRLEQLSSEAQVLERTYPDQAAHYWQQALALLPPSSAQYQSIVQRLQYLAQLHRNPSGPIAQTTDYIAPEPPGERALFPQAPPLPDRASVAFLKTSGSMLVSLIVYTIFFSSGGRAPLGYAFQFALGFVVLMLVHEMGHVFAVWHYRMSASPPIFVPFMGAVINLRQQPPNAWVEAVIGIGGPALGTVGALVAFVLALLFPNHPVLMEIAYFGFFLNLFNMVPVPPLDGGRITAAVSPRIWMLGLLVMAGWIAKDYFMRDYVNYFMIIILIVAWPRIRRTLQSRDRHLPYYSIPARASYSMAAMYLALGAVLVIFLLLSERRVH
jgi:Zn-dependent protease